MGHSDHVDYEVWTHRDVAHAYRKSVAVTQRVGLPLALASDHIMLSLEPTPSLRVRARRRSVGPGGLV